MYMYVSYVQGGDKKAPGVFPVCPMATFLSTATASGLLGEKTSGRVAKSVVHPAPYKNTTHLPTYLAIPGTY